MCLDYPYPKTDFNRNVFEYVSLRFVQKTADQDSKSEHSLPGDTAVWYHSILLLRSITIHLLQFVQSATCRDIATLLGVFAKFRKGTTSFVMCLSVRPSTWNNSAPTGRIFMKFEHVSIICRGNTLH
jgi:hypothetical protein